MNKRRDQGATLALIVVLAFVVVIIGVGFFFYSKIIGGGKELQHATDSGNLNVAKEVLRRPGVALTPGNEANEFGNLIDPVTNEVNLLTFNRLVGKAVIVAINADAEGTNQARTNAAACLDMVEGPSGIGNRLMTKISTHDQISSFFDALSTSNSTRMLQHNNVNSQISAVGQETAVSYMARGAASNAYLAANQIPAGTSFSLAAPTIVNKTVNGTPRTYLAGYVPLATGLTSVTPMAVPVRPGEQPHLVALDDFQAPGNLNTPLAGGADGPSRVPPNTFRSAGETSENNQTGSNVRMRSCAIVGALNVDFPASLPRGFVVVDNTGSLAFDGNIGGGNDIFKNQLMPPNFVDLATLPDGTPVLSDNGTPIEDIQGLLNQNPAPANLDAQLLAKGALIDSPSNMTVNQLKQLKNRPVSNCTTSNTLSGAGAVDPQCQNHLQDMANTYNTTSPSSNVNDSNLMAVEQFKCFILKVRAGFAMDGGGCGTADAPDECTGLKSYNHSAQHCLPCNFGGVGTLQGLLSQANGGVLVNDLRVRMLQIKPNADDGEINSVLNSSVPFGQVSYIYMNAAGSLVLDSSYPSLYPVPALVPGSLPDGNTQPYTSGNFNLNGTTVNVPSCEGYPNPWDCPAVPAEGEDRVDWTPSSGFRNLLGVIRFKNCAHGGGNWCCPC